MLEDVLHRKVEYTVLQRNALIIVTLLSTLLLVNLWPRFRFDAASFPWYGYVILIVLSAALLARKKK